MKNRANTLYDNIDISNVVQIPLSNIDMSKVDCKTLTLLVVEKKNNRKILPIFQLANKQLQLENLYGANLIIVLPNISPKIINLDRVDKIYQELPKLAE